jgi:hypothetical protein
MKHLLFSLAALLIINSVTFSQDSTFYEKENLSFFDWCIQDSVTHFTFITDVKKLKKNKKEDEYQPGKLVILNDGEYDTLKVKIRTRGNMRKKHCNFPPIKFKIAKKELEELDLDSMRTYKMVTHCKQKGKYEKWVYKELVAYKMYSAITDVSFRTYNITVDYVDENSGKVIESKVGFVIESKKDLEKRLNAKSIKKPTFHPRFCQPFFVSQMSMFQYMIGNPDWSFANLHNLKLVKLEDHQYPIPIAYDFDYAGLIETEYSVPDPQLSIEDVTQRVYMDVCREKELVQEVIDHFSKKEEEIIQCIYDVEELQKRDQRTMEFYIKDFFDIIRNPKNIDKKFRSTCDK